MPGPHRGAAAWHEDVLAGLADLFVRRELPAHIRSDIMLPSLSPTPCRNGERDWHEDSLHRSGITMGEWI